MTLYIYKLNDDCPAKTWDDVDYSVHGAVVAIITGNDNAACEAVAADKYGDTDIYAWGYDSFEDLPRIDNPAYIEA